MRGKTRVGAWKQLWSLILAAAATAGAHQRCRFVCWLAVLATAATSFCSLWLLRSLPCLMMRTMSTTPKTMATTELLSEHVVMLKRGVWRGPGGHQREH